MTDTEIAEAAALALKRFETPGNSTLSERGTAWYLWEIAKAQACIDAYVLASGESADARRYRRLRDHYDPSLMSVLFERREPEEWDAEIDIRIAMQEEK